MTIERESLEFARRNFERCEEVADRLLHELGVVTASIQGEATFYERQLICDLHRRAEAAERLYRHAYHKPAWEAAR